MKYIFKMCSSAIGVKALSLFKHAQHLIEEELLRLKLMSNELLVGDDVVKVYSLLLTLSVRLGALCQGEAWSKDTCTLLQALGVERFADLRAQVSLPGGRTLASRGPSTRPLQVPSKIHAVPKQLDFNNILDIFGIR
jgi:hypothetical protein